MNADLLASGLSVIDSSLKFYWGVRRLVCEGEGKNEYQYGEKMEEDRMSSKRQQPFSNGRSQNSLNSIHSITTSTWQKPKQNEHNLPSISEDNELDMGWSRSRTKMNMSLLGGN